jgi:hypothetical protein
VVYRWTLLRILASPAVFLLSIPVTIAQPILAQYLWLLALFSALVLRRLEPPSLNRRPPSATTTPADPVLSRPPQPAARKALWLQVAC